MHKILIKYRIPVPRKDQRHFLSTVQIDSRSRSLQRNPSRKFNRLNDEKLYEGRSGGLEGSSLTCVSFRRPEFGIPVPDNPDPPPAAFQRAARVKTGKLAEV